MALMNSALASSQAALVLAGCRRPPNLHAPEAALCSLPFTFAHAVARRGQHCIGLAPASACTRTTKAVPSLLTRPCRMCSPSMRALDLLGQCL